MLTAHRTWGSLSITRRLKHHQTGLYKDKLTDRPHTCMDTQFHSLDDMPMLFTVHSQRGPYNCYRVNPRSDDPQLNKTNMIFKMQLRSLFHALVLQGPPPRRRYVKNGRRGCRTIVCTSVYCSSTCHQRLRPIIFMLGVVGIFRLSHSSCGGPLRWHRRIEFVDTGGVQHSAAQYLARLAVHCLAPAIATVNVYRLWLLQMSVLHVVPCSLRAYCMYSLIILAVVNGHTCTDFSLW